jgi:branched-chain amino acid transport system substrate-binding protein
MRRAFVVVLVVLGVWVTSGCVEKDPILIGLSVELTGKQADIGINVRDAAQMAVDEVNARGGIRGRPIELVIRDDQGNPEVARRVDSELLSMGVVAIIGHYTSAQTEAVLDLMNQAGVVLISPSASSSEFSGKDDYFFRLIPDTTFVGQKLAQHVAEYHQIRDVLVIYDANNRSFSESYWHAFDTNFRERGGTTHLITYQGGKTDLKSIAAQIAEHSPESVLLIASAADTAVLAQYIRQSGSDAHLFASSWAQTNQLIEKGGQAVEGLELGAFYNQNNQNPAHVEFLQKFQQRFKRVPQLGTSQAYEVVMLLAKCLEVTDGKAAGLREALYAVRNFPGVLGPITFDAYGDVQRDVYILRIENGQFVEHTVLLPDLP